MAGEKRGEIILRAASGRYDFYGCLLAHDKSRGETMRVDYYWAMIAVQAQLRRCNGCWELVVSRAKKCVINISPEKYPASHGEPNERHHLAEVVSLRFLRGVHCVRVILHRSCSLFSPPTLFSPFFSRRQLTFSFLHTFAHALRHPRRKVLSRAPLREGRRRSQAM